MIIGPTGLSGLFWPDGERETAKAAAELVEKSGGEIVGFIFVINLFDLGGKKLLEKKGYKTYNLIDFPGH